MMHVAQSQPTGWMCPSCGKAHGPHIDTCPESSARVAPPHFAPPLFPPLPPVWPEPSKWVPPITPWVSAVSRTSGALDAVDREILVTNFWELAE